MGDTPDPLIDDTGSDDVHEIERKVTARMVPLRDLAAERKRARAAETQLAEERAGRAAALAELEALRPKAGRWDEHEAAEAKRVDDANAAVLATLPQESQDALKGLERTALSAALRGIAVLAGQAAAQDAPAAKPTGYPAGGGVSRPAAQGATNLTKPEQEFKESDPMLARASDERVKQLFALRHPKRG